MFDVLDQKFVRNENHVELSLAYLMHGDLFQKDRSRHYWLKRRVTVPYLYFKEAIGRYALSGNELMYYPKLAKSLRKVSSYPDFEMKFDISDVDEFKGPAFIAYFAECFEKHYATFEMEKAVLDEEVDALVLQYGHAVCMPRITQVLNDRQPVLFLNGIRYFVPAMAYWHHTFTYGHYYEDKSHRVIDLFSLMRLRDEPQGIGEVRVTVEGCIVNTPLLCVRYQERLSNKGHQRWIDLHERCWLTRSEAFKKATQHYGCKSPQEMTTENAS